VPTTSALIIAGVRAAAPDDLGVNQRGMVDTMAACLTEFTPVPGQAFLLPSNMRLPETLPTGFTALNAASGHTYVQRDRILVGKPLPPPGVYPVSVLAGVDPDAMRNATMTCANGKLYIFPSRQ
jgi:hypothetical protein